MKVVKILEIIKNYVTENELLIRIISSLVIFLVFFSLRGKFTNIITRIISKLMRKNESFANNISDSIRLPLKIFFAFFGIFIATQLINVNAKITAFGIKSLKIAVIVLLSWALINFVSVDSFLFKKLNKSSENINLTVFKFISNILKVIIVCIAFVIVLNELGYNITGVITGLGLSGLTLSLAAKDTVQNMIGGFMIIFDKPFQVGDYIELSGKEGFVENITMRSTRIRTNDGSEIIIPNSVVTNDSIKNISKTSNRIIDITANFTYDSKTLDIKSFENEIKSYIINNSNFDEDTMRVTLNELASSSVDVRIWCLTKTDNLKEYYEIKENINFLLIEAAERNNLKFAFPSRSLYIEENK